MKNEGLASQGRYFFYRCFHMLFFVSMMWISHNFSLWVYACWRIGSNNLRLLCRTVVWSTATSRGLQIKKGLITHPFNEVDAKMNSFKIIGHQRVMMNARMKHWPLGWARWSHHYRPLQPGENPLSIEAGLQEGSLGCKWPVSISPPPNPHISCVDLYFPTKAGVSSGIKTTKRPASGILGVKITSLHGRRFNSS